jgi:hypothetical protein
MLTFLLRRQLSWLLAALFFCCLPAFAHEVPVSATLQLFVKPEGQTLRVLARVPLSTYADAEYPRKSGNRGAARAVDLANVDFALQSAATITLIQNLSLYEGGRLLPKPKIAAARLSIFADNSFTGYDTALAHVTGPPLPPETDLFWEQAKLDVLLDYPIESERADFSVRANFDRLALNTNTALLFIAPGGVKRAYELHGDSGLVHIDPSWGYAAWRFLALGFEHILEGTDHLLFLFCLILPFAPFVPLRRAYPLVPIITAFTVAHSITLIASAYGAAPDVLWFPPLIELLIALSIIYMALENILVESPARRWIVTFFFGLVHGFGFSFILRQTMQFAGDHVLSALLAFNVGVEIGQLAVLALFAPLLNLLLWLLPTRGRLVGVIVSALIAHQAWHWMGERFEALSRFPWPKITPEGMMSGLRWATALVVIAALMWLISLLKRRSSGSAKGT